MKQLAIIALVLFAAFARAQAVKMDVYLNDQTIESFDIDSIVKMEFTHTDTFPHYTLMQVFPPVHLHIEFHQFENKRVDSLTFADVNFPGSLHIYEGDSLAYEFRLVGKPIHIDSIVFKQHAIDTNVLTLINPVGYHDLQSALWAGDHIHTTTPYKITTVDSTYRVIARKTPSPPHAGGLLVDIHPEGNKLLEVKHQYLGQSRSTLYEYDRQTNKAIPLAADDSAITCAKYLQGVDNAVLFYTHGNAKDIAGYYIFDLTSGGKTLFLRSDANPWPHTFDLSDDGKKLLTSSPSSAGRCLIEVDLLTLKADTLRPNLGIFYQIWLQYNQDASKILYNTYPAYAVYGSVGHTEIGIIDRSSLSVKKLNTGIDSERDWVCLFPTWSPDEKTIAYSLGWAPYYPGEIHNYQICILKSLE